MAEPRKKPVPKSKPVNIEEKTSDLVMDNPRRTHFITVRMDEEGGKVVVDITGVSELEAVKMLEGALETLDATLPEVVVVRDGKTIYSSDGILDDDDD